MSILDAVIRSGTKVAVLCGGPGGEREVSLASGENVHKALVEAGLDNRLAIAPESDPAAFVRNLECDLAVMMFHGEFGEDGTAQAILEERRIPFTGSDSRACALAMDKSAVKNLCLAHGVPTARWAVCDDPGRAESYCRARNLKFPLFVKPNFGGSSVGASRIDGPGDVEAAVAKALAVGPLALIEEMVIGRELTVGWLDGRILPAIELRAAGEFYDYEAKYLSEATRYVCPADVPGEIADAIGRHTAAMAEFVGARDLARVDFMLGEDGPKALELNALPGFTAHSLVPMAAAAAGTPLPDLCLSLVGMAARRAGIV